MADYTCYDCKLYDPDRTNYRGYGYCIHYRNYYPKSEPKCGNFDRRDDCELRSNCFLTTTICHIFEYEDDCYGLNVMREFRDTILVSDSKYYPLLAEYDVIGPIISKKLYEDSYRDEVANYYFENYIYDIIVNLSTKRNYNDAVEKYVDMVNDMKRMYDIHMNITDKDVKVLSRKIANNEYKLKRRS